MLKGHINYDMKPFIIIKNKHVGCKGGIGENHRRVVYECNEPMLKPHEILFQISKNGGSSKKLIKGLLKEF